MTLPTTEIQLPFVRQFGSITQAGLGQGVPVDAIGNTALGGFYLQPFHVPENYDRSREARLYAYLSRVVDGIAAANVLIRTDRTIGPPPGPPTDTVHNQPVPIPFPWPANAFMEIELLDAGGPFLPAGIVPPNALLGFRITRNGPDPLDTWSGSLGLVFNAKLRYHALCLQCCPC